MSNSSSPIETISDTALGVAFCRAIESDRADAHFCDPFARILAGDRGEKIIRTVAKKNLDSAGWGIVTRTCIIDSLIQKLIERENIDTVLNLGAGLDTRPYRMKLPALLEWIEVDLPDILHYKQEKLVSKRANCSLRLLPLDLSNIESRNYLFSQINAQAKKVLVISEGLLVYLLPEEVGKLAQNLHIQSNFKWWISDFVSPLPLQLMKILWKSKLKVNRSTLKFAPGNIDSFFRPCGWKMNEFYSLLQEAHSLNRAPRFGSILRRLTFLTDGTALLKSEYI